MKRSALLLLALTSTLAMTGCCGWPWPWPCNYGNGYMGPGFVNPSCPTGNCGVPGQQYIPPQTGFYQSYGSIQAAQVTTPAVPTPISAPTTVVEQPQQGTVHRTAMVPLQSLPTYP
ncbi:MAG: hypothetical protein Tsb009_31080 [Planctomycetaceae bacterium]